MLFLNYFIYSKSYFSYHKTDKTLVTYSTKYKDVKYVKLFMYL